MGRGGCVAVSWGRWGGFYWRRGETWRLCLGWVALTVFFEDLDDVLHKLADGERAGKLRP